jgi:hypothetical protein
VAQDSEQLYDGAETSIHSNSRILHQYLLTFILYIHATEYTSTDFAESSANGCKREVPVVMEASGSRQTQV